MTKEQKCSAEVEQQKVASPEGFSKGVNDYLNQYVTVLDAKAGGFFAAALVVAAYIADSSFDPFCGIRIELLALGLIALSGGSAVLCLLPRLPKTSRGLLFWGDIRTFDDVDRYVDKVRLLGVQDVEVQYSMQNYVVSRVLVTKCRLMQWSVVLFLLGVVTVMCARWLGC